MDTIVNEIINEQKLKYADQCDLLAAGTNEL